MVERGWRNKMMGIKVRDQQREKEERERTKWMNRVVLSPSLFHFYFFPPSLGGYHFRSRWPVISLHNSNNNPIFNFSFFLSPSLSLLAFLSLFGKDWGGRWVSEEGRSVSSPERERDEERMMMMRGWRERWEVMERERERLLYSSSLQSRNGTEWGIEGG